MATNTFVAGQFMHFNGAIQALARIQKLDIATSATVAPLAQPNQTPATWVTPGPNVLAPVNGRDGFRLGDWIKVHGISLSIRARGSLLNLTATPIPLYEHVHVYWKICATMYEDSHLINATPLPEAMLKLPRFGFSKRLDTDEELESIQYRVKTLAQGKFRLTVKSISPEVKFINRYVDLSANPLKVEYAQDSQNGAKVMRWKPFIVFRCNVPDNVNYISYQPTLNCCTKLHYTDQ